MIRTIRRALGTSTAGRSLYPALMGSATTRSSVIRQRLDTSYHGFIMPKVVTANLNAPVMTAEKIADRIRGKTSLPPSNAPYYPAGRRAKGAG